MNRSFSKSAAARLAVSLMFAWLLTMMVGTGPVGAQDAPAPTAEATVEVESADQAEVLSVNGVMVLSTDPEIDESGWVQCRQSTGTQPSCQQRVDRKLGRLGFAPVDWSDPDGAVQYMSGLYYENKPDKNVISFCTREMSARWSEGACWVHPSPTATTAPTETPEPTATATATTPATPTATATGTQLPTATATNTPVPTATAFPTATATSTAMPTATVTPTRGDPWTGHSLTLGSFCSPTGEQGNPIGQEPGKALTAYIGVFTGSTDSTDGDWWGGDNSPTTGWTQTTQLSYGQAPRVWSYATSVDQPLLGWFFIDPTSGEIAQAAADPVDGFHMGGTRDSKWLASLHECEPATLTEQPTGTPPPAPAGEQSAALRQNGGGPDSWFETLARLAGVLVFIALVLTGAWMLRRW